MTFAVIRVELVPAGSGRTSVVHDGIEIARSGGAVIGASARRLVEDGRDPAARLEAFRGPVFCIGGRLGALATLTVDESCMAFRRWMPPARIRQTEGGTQ